MCMKIDNSLRNHEVQRNFIISWKLYGHKFEDIIKFRKLMNNIPGKRVLMIDYINHLYNSNKDFAFIKFSLNSCFALLSITTPDATEISEIFL